MYMIMDVWNWRERRTKPPPPRSLGSREEGTQRGSTLPAVTNERPLKVYKERTSGKRVSDRLTLLCHGVGHFVLLLGTTL
jgi:hypothetical protein